MRAARLISLILVACAGPDAISSQAAIDCTQLGHTNAGGGGFSLAAAQGQSQGVAPNATHGFLAGCEEEADAQGKSLKWSTNFAPPTWNLAHIHRGSEPLSKYYYQSTPKEPGDATPGAGIDTFTFVYRFGHGTRLGWLMNGGDVAINKYVRLGDGALRYFWQCSCNTMAHGVYDAVKKDYKQPLTGPTCPNDKDACANVRKRWKSSFDPKLRLVCGGASKVCTDARDVTDRIWDNFDNKDYDVADAFLDGIYSTPSGTPLCMTRGAEHATSTPLYDTDFHSADNGYNPATDGEAYIHLLFPVQFEKEGAPLVEKFKRPHPEGDYPVYSLERTAIGLSQDDVELEVSDWLRVSTDKVNGRGPRTRVDERSGAVYVREALQHAPWKLNDLSGRDEDFYFSKANQFVSARGWTESDVDRVSGVRLVIESAKVNAKAKDAVHSVKNVFVVYKREIVVNRQGEPAEHVPVLGPGGEIAIQMNRDGSIINASKVWRKASESAGAAKPTTISLTVAKQEARRRLNTWGEEGAYKEAPEEEFSWGYREEAGNCRQKVMRLVYKFTFAPKDEFADYAPITIEVPAQGNPTGSTNLCDLG